VVQLVGLDLNAAIICPRASRRNWPFKSPTLWTTSWGSGACLTRTRRTPWTAH